MKRERVGRSERPLVAALLDDADDHGKDREETAKRGGIEVSAAVRQLAQHERRHGRMVGEER